MTRLPILLFVTILAGGAEDPWTKVRELKSGTELRIYKKDAKQPLLVKMDEATDESLLVVLKNEQVSIPKDQIDRIDYRPTRTGGRVITENKTATVDPDLSKMAAAGRPRDSHGPTSASSSNVTVNSKPDFEPIYRRAPKLPAPSPAR